MKQKDHNSINRISVTVEESNDGLEYLQNYQPVVPHLIRKGKQCASSGMAQGTGIHELLLWEVFVQPGNGVPFPLSSAAHRHFSSTWLVNIFIWFFNILKQLQNNLSVLKYYTTEKEYQVLHSWDSSTMPGKKTISILDVKFNFDLNLYDSQFCYSVLTFLEI